MDWMQYIRVSIKKLQALDKTPTKIRMSPQVFDNVREEAHRYMAYGIRDDDPCTIIIDSDGSQIPMGTIYGLEIYIDNKLPPDISYME